MGPLVHLTLHLITPHYLHPNVPSLQSPAPAHLSVSSQQLPTPKGVADGSSHTFNICS